MTAHTATPSAVSVSISLTRKEQGALYMKSLRQAKRITELKESNADLMKALTALVDCINETRGTDATEALAAARAALTKAGA